MARLLAVASHRRGAQLGCFAASSTRDTSTGTATPVAAAAGRSRTDATAAGRPGSARGGPTTRRSAGSAARATGGRATSPTTRVRFNPRPTIGAPRGAPKARRRLYAASASSRSPRSSERPDSDRPGRVHAVGSSRGSGPRSELGARPASLFSIGARTAPGAAGGANGDVKPAASTRVATRPRSPRGAGGLLLARQTETAILSDFPRGTIVAHAAYTQLVGPPRARKHPPPSWWLVRALAGRQRRPSGYARDAAGCPRRSPGKGPKGRARRGVATRRRPRGTGPGSAIRHGRSEAPM